MLNLKIKMIPVESSNVKSVGYDEDNKNIYVELINGKCYTYVNVPKKIFEDLLIAPSIGSYINRYLKDSYTLKSINSFYELKKASNPLIDYLNKYYNPHTIAIVKEGKVTVLTEEMGLPLEVRD